MQKYLPDDILNNYLNEEQVENFKTGNTGIFSVTVFAEKPKKCCGSDCCS